MKTTFIFIDDEPICNLISKKILTSEYPDSQIFIFQSGTDAIDYFESNAEQLKKEKILINLDINMPEMNGFEFLVEFEQRFAKAFDADVFILSSSQDPNDKAQAGQFEIVKNFYSKPFQVSYVEGYV
jgi:CheY-like chemotaxis protein